MMIYDYFLFPDKIFLWVRELINYISTSPMPKWLMAFTRLNILSACLSIALGSIIFVRRKKLMGKKELELEKEKIEQKLHAKEFVNLY